jgi:hypothetical protein
VAVAIRTGGNPADWLDDLRALATAVELIAAADRAQRR